MNGTAIQAYDVRSGTSVQPAEQPREREVLGDDERERPAGGEDPDRDGEAAPGVRLGDRRAGHGRVAERVGDAAERDRGDEEGGADERPPAATSVRRIVRLPPRISPPR